MSVKVSLEFKSVDEAIVALGKLVGAPETRSAAQSDRGIATSDSMLAPTPAAPTTRPGRKPRADKGQPREPYGPRTTEANAAVEAGTKCSEVGSGAAGAAAAVTTPGKTAEQAVNPTATVPPAAPAPAPVAAPTDAVVQAAVERLFNAKDYDATAAVLSKFGVKRGKDLAPDQRAEFIRRVDDILAGKYDALSSWPQ